MNCSTLKSSSRKRLLKLSVIPFEIKTIQDVVDHYQELVDLFESWPRETEPGTVTLEDGTTQYYDVVEEGI